MAASAPTSQASLLSHNKSHYSHAQQQLLQILSDESNADSIAWLPHGLAFIIVDRHKLISDVLPKYFDKIKYTSFTRKLKRWQFVRVPSGDGGVAFYNKVRRIVT